MKTIIFILLLIPILGLSQTLNITTGSETRDSLPNYTVTMSGQCELHLNGASPMEGTTFNINSDDAWVYFHGVKPSYVADRLSQFKINGVAAIFNENVRIEQYKLGAVVIPHADNYAGATLYLDADYAGASMELEHFKFYRTTELGSFNNAISSFKLKKGYMMTIAQEANGTGYSKNYVANEADIEIKQLPTPLDNAVSFVRVMQWNWPTKKGYTSGADNTESLDATWFYNWSSGKSSSKDVEYVPMKWGGGDAGTNFTTKKNITHQLAYNEPGHSEQANMTVDAALKFYPTLLESGLRSGSPGIADDGKAWLYEFMERADELNYRVDFVAVHWYKGGQTAKQFYNYLKGIHDKTGRPIWITEFNNGAGWTCCAPQTQQEQADKINSFINMLDTCSFVERYAIFNWVKPERAVIDSTGNFTKAGIVYRNKVSPVAYKDDGTFGPVYTELPAPVGISAKLDGNTASITWRQNAYNEDGFSIERSVNGGDYSEIGTVPGSSSLSMQYSDTQIDGFGKFTYRVRTYKGSNFSSYSNEAYVLKHDGTFEVVKLKNKHTGSILRSTSTDVELVDATQNGNDVKWFIEDNGTGYVYIENIGDRMKLHRGEESEVDLSENKWTGSKVQWSVEAKDDTYNFLICKDNNKKLVTIQYYISTNRGLNSPFYPSCSFFHDEKRTKKSSRKNASTAQLAFLPPLCITAAWG